MTGVANLKAHGKSAVDMDTFREAPSYKHVTNENGIHAMHDDDVGRHEQYHGRARRCSNSSIPQRRLTIPRSRMMPSIFTLALIQIGTKRRFDIDWTESC